MCLSPSKSHRADPAERRSPGTPSGRTENADKCQANSCLPSMKPRSHPNVETARRPSDDFFISYMPEQSLFWNIFVLDGPFGDTSISFDLQMRYAVALDRRSSKKCLLPGHRLADLIFSHSPLPVTRRQRERLRL